MIALVLLYVGAVLGLNGIWLLGHIQDREIGIINVFSGGIILIAAIISMVLGALRDDFTAIVFGAQILLFSFTYLWLAYNRYVNVDGRGLGWYSLFVALTAAPTAALILVDTERGAWMTWLGVNWAAWAVLWFLYWVLLGLQRPITRITGVVTLLVGIGTGWLPAYLLLTDYLTLPA